MLYPLHGASSVCVLGFEKELYLLKAVVRMLLASHPGFGSSMRDYMMRGGSSFELLLIEAEQPFAYSLRVLLVYKNGSRVKDMHLTSAVYLAGSPIS